jgi:hypothetical protein
MNTAEFFMKHFGIHFITPSGNAWADVATVLRSAYPKADKPDVSSRMQSGWAIIRPGSATLQLDLAIPVVQKSRMTRVVAFTAELDAWDGVEPRIFMVFDKAPIAAQHIFLSVDKRMVRICTKDGAISEDWTTRKPFQKVSKK